MIAVLRKKSWKHWHDWCSDAKSALKEIEIETKPFAILLIQTSNKNNFVCNFSYHWNKKQTFLNASKRSHKLIQASNKEVFKIFCDHPCNFNIRTEYNRKLLMPNNYVFCFVSDKLFWFESAPDFFKSLHHVAFAGHSHYSHYAVVNYHLLDHHYLISRQTRSPLSQ